MNTIQVAFCDFWQGVNKDAFILVKALRENYGVEILEDPAKADYVFFSVFGDEHWFLSDNCIKIFYTGENFCPDFNACDYAVGFDWMDYGDRYLRLPNYLTTPFFKKPTLLMEQKHLLPIPDKTTFCSFVVSQSSGNPMRFKLFEALSSYKRVDCGGRWNNNVGGPVADKLSFDKVHKFTLAGENASHPGYTTEKLVEAFAAQTVPIYWGDPDVEKVFNPKAFINANRFELLQDLVAEVIRLDNAKEEYLYMLRQPALINPGRDSYDSNYQRLVDFMKNIVEQSMDKAKRYGRDEWGRNYIERQRQNVALRKPKSDKQLLKEIVSRHIPKLK